MNDIVVCLFVSFGYDKAAQGLTGEGRRLADLAGGALRVIIVGGGADALATEVAAVADQVLLADQPELAEYQPETCLAVLTELCRQQPARAVLLGGLGMGYTLRALLDRLPEAARVTAVELVPELCAWNRGPLAALAGRPLDDPRVRLEQGDVVFVPPRFATDALYEAIESGVALGGGERVGIAGIGKRLEGHFLLPIALQNHVAVDVRDYAIDDLAG